MPSDNSFLEVPFITRDMLSFKHGLRLQLRLSYQSVTATTLTIRGMTREGIFTYTQVVTGTGGVTTATFGLPDIPIYISVFEAGIALKQGDCFVTLSVVANGDTLYQCFSGFIYQSRGLSWPETHAEVHVPGHARIVSYTGTNPAAGVEVTEGPGSTKMWRLISMSVTLVAAAAAATRRVHLVVDGYTGVALNAFGSTDQIISETKMYTFAAFGGIPGATNDNDILCTIPAEVWVLPERTFYTQTFNLNAGDNFGAPEYTVEEYLIEA